jgi:NADH:ubiquinone oxidoreductase subunit 4 (subunit M)
LLPVVERIPKFLTFLAVFYFFTLLFCPYFQEMDFGYKYFGFYDSFSTALCAMTALFFFICMWLGADKNPLSYNYYLLIMQFLLYSCFTTNDLFIFYICFELVTLFMYFVILY